MTDQNDNGNGAREQAARTARETKSMGEDIKGRAASAAGSAKAEAARRADSAKGSVAVEVERIASALRAGRDELRGDSTAERTFAWAADGLDRAAGMIRDRDSSQLMNDLGEFARRNPSVFLGGAALIGFAASRFAKASTRTHHSGVGNAAYAGEGNRAAGTPGASAGATKPITPSSPAASTTPGGAYNS